MRTTPQNNLWKESEVIEDTRNEENIAVIVID